MRLISPTKSDVPRQLRVAYTRYGRRRRLFKKPEVDGTESRMEAVLPVLKSLLEEYIEQNASDKEDSTDNGTRKILVVRNWKTPAQK